MNGMWRLTAFRVSLLVALALSVLYLTTVQSRLVRNLEAKLLDLRFQLRGVRQPEVPVAIVLIDEKSIAALGRWPWSRSRFADLVRRLDAAGAKVIAFDVLFLEPEVPAEREAMQQVLTTFEALPLPHRDEAWQALHRYLMTMAALDPDRDLATALQTAGNVVLAFASDATPAGHPVRPAAPPAFMRQAAYRVIRQAARVTPALPLPTQVLRPPITALGQQAKALGHVKVAFDTDGTLRYDYPVIASQEAYYPSFALQAVRLYLDLAPEEMAVYVGQGIQLGPHVLPTDEATRWLVNYYGPPGTFPTYSLVDVLQDHGPAMALRDRIVLIGAGAVGLGDTFVTPFSEALLGVERHATLMANILRGDGLQRRDATAWLDLGCLVGLSLALGWLSPRWPWLWGTLCALGLAGGYAGLNYLLLVQAGWWLHLLFPLLGIGVTHGALTLYKAFTEERQKRQIRRAFQYYLHPTVVEQVSASPEQLKLGGEARELTVLFSDIRNFSTTAEQLPPAALVQFLNEYFSAMTRLVITDRGLLDKYIGDAVMAVYGAPLATPDHAYQACHSALQMLVALRTLQPQWRARGLPLIDIGIGINTGVMIVGNMGAADLRLNYTVTGDEVNLGARLEGANKEYGTNILISASTWEQVQGRLATRELDVIQVKGKTRPTRIFEVLGFLPPSAAQATLIRLFTAGLQAYRTRQWEAALGHFRQALSYAPDDRPSQLYVRRCEAFLLIPPPADWDGVYVMQMK